jgi:hypothetical protein
MGSKIASQMIKEVRKIYNINKRDLKKFIKIKKSRYNHTKYYLDVRSSRLNAKRFSPKKLKKKGKMSVRIRKDNGRRTLKVATFVAKNGALLQRKGKTQDIVGVQTISIPQMFNKKILKEAEQMVQKETGTKLKDNFAFYLGKA